MINKKIKVRILSFNIAHGLGMDGKVDLERVACLIEETKADIIGLQEVDRFFSERSDFVDQARWLGNRLGMDYAYGANLDENPTEGQSERAQYGNAILSRYPIQKKKNHLLTQVYVPKAENEQRGVLEAQIKVEGKTINFYNAHLALEDEELKVHIEELMRITQKSKYDKVIVGDLNSPPINEHIQKLNNDYLDTFEHTGKTEVYTFPSVYENPLTGEHMRPNRRIDYIFASKELIVEEAEAVETGISDHLPIFADIEIVQKK